MLNERITERPVPAGAADALLRVGRFFSRGLYSSDLRDVSYRGGRNADTFYRDRWAHDKIVRSTHGVNCTGSCSWTTGPPDPADAGGNHPTSREKSRIAAKRLTRIMARGKAIGSVRRAST